MGKWRLCWVSLRTMLIGAPHEPAIHLNMEKRYALINRVFSNCRHCTPMGIFEIKPNVCVNYPDALHTRTIFVQTFRFQSGIQKLNFLRSILKVGTKFNFLLFNSIFKAVSISNHSTVNFARNLLKQFQ